jgi:hypothetical protein
MSGRVVSKLPDLPLGVAETIPNGPKRQKKEKKKKRKKKGGI